MIVSVDEARPFFEAASQRRWGMVDPDQLPEEGVEYRTFSGVCLAFHPAPWPDVWMVHLGVKPEVWGFVEGPVRRLLGEFWDENQPKRIVAWVKAENRPVLALARRIGFETHGGFDEVVMIGWRQRCQ